MILTLVLVRSELRRKFSLYHILDSIFSKCFEIDLFSKRFAFIIEFLRNFYSIKIFCYNDGVG